jgi:hypothetical protein
MGSERGQGTVEWVGLVTLVSLVLLGLVAAGVWLPGTSLARSLADRILCAAALVDGCGGEPALIAAYGSEVGDLVRQHMPNLVFEAGSRAVPVDFRRCRSSECGDSVGEGMVQQTDEQLPVTVFVHVVDCREGEETPGANCSGERAGNLYVQYWTYYADSATLRGVPVVGGKGYHHDDWEGVQLRFRPNGEVDERASSHNGYNYERSPYNWGADTGKTHHPGWGAETGLLFVSGGSHAGSAFEFTKPARFTPGHRVHLIPLEQIAADSSDGFAISPPWLKQVWTDPEAEGTS